GGRFTSITDTMTNPATALHHYAGLNCRTIENYIPIEVLGRVLQGLYTKPLLPNLDRYSDALRPEAPSVKGPDKVKVAREVVRRWESGLDYLDLHRRIAELASLIESANGHQPSMSATRLKATPAFNA
ncbi:hypothetical protein, partial [Mycolicibacterium litorale]|uniref:hypothetical protein n=1 Tax=Mycolicibacterium litorale TaxID=758802 RepID=UPI0039A18E4A